ncbi:MAG: DUF11 domain-containing protein [Lachnospiraceae bacterium]|nr:DUF11 domain-containing protein [Lachnospiraceae bacterium]
MTRLRDYFFALIFVSTFTFIVLFVLFSSAAYAATGNSSILTKDDMSDFEKLTFYDTHEKNLIGTDPEGRDVSDVKEYSFLSNHRIVETDGTVTAEYGKVGRFHDREISVIMTFSDFAIKSVEIDPQRDGRYFAIPYSFRDNFHFDGDSLIQKFVFYYADDPDRTPIDMTNSFIVINGLNVDEYAGISSGQRVYLSENSQLEYKSENGFDCYGNGPQGYSDTCIEGDDDVKYELDGVYYEEDLSNPLYYVCSAMFTLNGTENSLYIEDKRASGGYGIGWCLDLTTLHVTYNIKTSVEHGSITDSISDIAYNSSRKIEYSPEENYVLDSITVDGTPVDISTAPSAYDFNNITQDHEIHVVYKLPYKKVITEVVNGTITPSDEQVLFGSDKKIDYAPNEGYLLDSITIDDNDSPVDISRYKDSFSFSNIQEDHKIKVVYEKPTPPVKKVLDKNGEYINGKYVSAGDIITYEISYKNPLTRKAELTITDSIPSNTEFYDASDGGKYADGKTVWKISAEPLKEGSIKMRVRVLSSAKGNKISNYALLMLDDVSLMSNTVENPVPSDPVKKVKNTKGKDINETFVEKDQELIYYISYKNPASSEKKIQIKDEIPKGMKYISADSGGSVKNNEVIWKLTLKAGEEKQVSFKVKAESEGKTYINQATVVTDGISLVTNKVENWVPEKPEKEVKQNGVSVDGKDISDGETVIYYVTVKNTSSEATDIKIEDEISKYLDVKSVSDGGTYNNGSITWKLKAIPAGETKTVNFTAKAKGDSESHKVPNTAYMTIGDKKLSTNEVTINIPAVKRLEVLGEKITPAAEPEVSPNSGVLGERKVPTGDGSNIIVLILVAMCAFAGIVLVRIRNVQK